MISNSVCTYVAGGVANHASCFWQDTAGASLQKQAIISDCKAVIYIPAIFPKPAVGGYIIRLVTANTDAKSLIAAGALKIAAVDDYNYGGLGHWRVTAK